MSNLILLLLWRNWEILILFAMGLLLLLCLNSIGESLRKCAVTR